MTEASQEDHDGGGVEEGCCGGEGCPGVFPKTSVPADPGEEAFPDPAPGMNGEADLIGRLPDDLDVDQRGSARPISGKAGIGEGLRHERKGAPRQAQDRQCAVAILDAGGLGIENEGAPIRRPWLGAYGP